MSDGEERGKVMSDGDRTHFADDATLEYISKLESERDRYKEALEVYAHRGNWKYLGDTSLEAVWHDGDGWELAEQALKGDAVGYFGFLGVLTDEQ